MGTSARAGYRGPVQAVIFDWAGTTVDFGSLAPAVVFIEVFRRRGVDITMQQAREPMGLAKRLHIKMITEMPSVASRWREVVGHPVTEEDIDSLYAEFIPLQLDCLSRYADLIPGTLETVDALRKQNIKIGSTTGYNREMLEILLREGKARGFEPDSSVCASDVPAGRPHPWMAVRAAAEMQVYPFHSIVKVGDTVPDIGEGLNAGTWTVGTAETGNEVGLSLADLEALDPNLRARMRARARERLSEAGAHYVIDGVSELPPILEDINARLAKGDRP
ncbi:MAG: phosphonoacetaldehyde hydrolase [Candidatus Omnitrophica bacterium]|nr:phosphonoacetaldehyde hydrolase [Candidatus Omnitrophota bacterium]